LRNATADTLLLALVLLLLLLLLLLNWHAWL
jgi:hypothetical protein